MRSPVRVRCLAAFLIVATLARAVGAENEIAVLVAEAEELGGFGAAGRSLQLAREAARRAQATGDVALLARSLAIIGTGRAYQGDPGGGRAEQEEALATAIRSRDRSAEAAVKMQAGLTSWRRAEYDRASEQLGEAARIQEEIGDRRGLARTLDLIGRVRFKRADYEGALVEYRRAVSIQQTLGDLKGLSATLEDLGDLDQERGAYASAFAHYRKALQAREAAGDARGRAYMTALLGRCYMLQGAYRRAAAYYSAALEIAQKSGEPHGRATARHHLGIVSSLRGRPQEALEHFTAALEDYRSIGDTREEGWVLGRIGEARRRGGDLAGALAANEESVALRERLGDLRGLGSELERSAAIHAEGGDLPSALAILERARALRAKAQPTRLPGVLSAIGRIHAERGEGPRALEEGQRALDLARGSGNEESHWAAAHGLARIRRALGLREAALESLRESLAVIERLRSSLVGSDEARVGFLEDKQAVYGDTIGLMVDLGRTEEALEVAERARARAFLDLLRSRESRDGETDVEWTVPALPEEEDEPDGPPPTRIPTAPPTLSQIRDEAIRRRVTVVEYFSAADRLFIWVIGPDGSIRAATTPTPRRELADLVGRMRTAMTGPTPARGVEDELETRGPASDFPGAAAPDPRPALRQLHRLLIEPIRPWLPTDPAAAITIVAHGPLFLVSFAALLDGADRYLVERHTIHYAPSIAVLTETRRRRERTGDREQRLLVVGNPTMPTVPGRRRALAPLPAAESEARAIGSLFPASRVETLTGARARERVVGKLAADRRVLHLATHGVLLDDEPLESFVALAPDPPASGGMAGGRSARPESDGLWSAREVFRLRLRADLVTLSACNTGLGGISGDGVIGLSRAFFSAGASTVVASLWRVADVASRFQMECFYRALRANGGKKAAALRQAELETLEALRAGRLRTPAGRPLPEHPLFWAPFILMGEPD